MGQLDWRKYKAIESKFYKDPQFDFIPEKPGIYLWTRYEAPINKTYFYVGKAKNLKQRRWNYYALLCGLDYPDRWFENSLKAHNDWKYQIIEQCPIDKLDEREQYWILEYQKKDNYITRNEKHGKQDVAKSNKKRIEKEINKYENKLRKHLSRISIQFGDGCLIIGTKWNKDGTENKLSSNSYEELVKWFEKMLIGTKNEKIQ